MPDFRSVVERAVHRRLQQLTYFRMSTPLFAALVFFSSFPIAGRVSALVTKSSVCRAEGFPLLKSLFDAFTRALNAASLRVRILQWRHLSFRGDRQLQGNDIYPTPRAEAKYWRIAGRYQRRLYSGSTSTDTTCVPSKTSSRGSMIVPLVTYYTPRLLPLYRKPRNGGKHTSRETDVDDHESRVSPKTFCKWHRMVFHAPHPTLAQASVQMKYYSNRDLGEIQRIARLLPDEKVFRPKGRIARKAERTTKYREMWRSWLGIKGKDLVIVFE